MAYMLRPVVRGNGLQLRVVLAPGPQLRIRSPLELPLGILYAAAIACLGLLASGFLTPLAPLLYAAVLFLLLALSLLNFVLLLARQSFAA